MTPSSAPAEPRPALVRARDGRLLAGVACGLADHLGLPVLWVRAGFVLLALVSGFGILLYAGLWLTVPVASSPQEAIGQQAAARLGLRPGVTATDGPSSARVGLLLSAALVALGGVLIIDQTVGSGTLWPLVVVALGAAVIWQQAEVRDLSWATAARVGAGVVVLAVGLVLVIVGRGDLSALLDGLFVVLVVLVGVGIIAGPWVLRLVRDLADERRERILSQERADVAAHLHDSVLQTLAVIQRRSTDATEVARLARAQERDLRRWLYGEEGEDPAALATALAGLVAAVEDTYGVSVDLVVVGDATTVEDAATVSVLVGALREGLVNAARHAGVSTIAMYVEVTAQEIEAFVRDRGRGFDPADTPPEGRGVQGSIVGRVQRHGGEAEVTSELGVGTQVRIRMPREGT